MSRVGKQPIKIPSGVRVKITAGAVEVEGPRGKINTPIPAGISLELADGQLVARRQDDSKQMRALHGLTRKLVANAVQGVAEGFQKELDVVGIGYKAEVKGKTLVLSLGYSHPIDFPIPEGISIRVERLPRTIRDYQTSIIVSGADKQKVGQVAANIRFLRPPDPYKGKGIRYAGEALKLKVGKKGA